MRSIRRLLLFALISSLPACAPTVWEKPGTTPAEFSADAIRCNAIVADANHAADKSPDVGGSGAMRSAAGDSHSRCMAEKGYVASASSPPRGSRTKVYRPAATKDRIAAADTEYYQSGQGGDLFRFEPFDAKSAATPTASPGGGLLADLSAKWRQIASILNF